ncbi:MAG: prepilin-type N-terminal cleavage/methylation domain-containing protein [Patescibacteria group bacterium]|nr:prepilin-type N-terminal cleavage/methylation domain-containing protein [Patescibacteria group bacterium]
MRRGFTFIEMMVVMTITVLILGIGYVNYRIKERKELVLLDARRLASILKQAQSLALSAQQMDSSLPRGYGVYLPNNNTYIFFATNNDYLYDSGEAIFNYSLSKNIFFNPFSSQHQVFALPLASLYVNNVACSTNQTITLQDSRTNEQKKVKINCLSGQIEVSD